MFKYIKNWFNKKLTIILAPSTGSRAIHLRLSYPFITSLLLILVSIFSAGAYMSQLYINYSQALSTNKKLVQQKNIYSKQVEETLDMLNKVKQIELRLRGLLGMKSQRNIIENYHIGGTDSSFSLPNEADSIFDLRRMDSNIDEVKRVAWEQQSSMRNIENFIEKKKDILLSTPSIWPTFGYVTSGFGWRTHPISKKQEFHRALDMYNPLGKNTPIRATARGRIVVSGWAGGFGKMVIIDHGNGFSTRYCHCSKIIVKQGEQVEQGQIISYIGNTGMSTGNHLHYEVWHKGKPVNPIKFVQGR